MWGMINKQENQHGGQHKTNKDQQKLDTGGQLSLLISSLQEAKAVLEP